MDSTRIRSRLRKLLAVALRAALLFAAVGTLISLGPRDAILPTAVIYYATPWLVTLAIAGTTLVALRNHPSWRYLSLAILLISLSGGFQSYRQLKPQGSLPDTGSISVCNWNAARNLDDLQSEWRFTADIVAIVETGTFRNNEWPDFQKALPAYQWQQLDQGTILGVRGKILNHQDQSLHDRYQCHRVEIDLNASGPLTLVVADIRSQPWISRKPAISALFQAARGPHPAIILGDFNTPPDSVHFDAWRNAGFTLANDNLSDGFRETWGWGLPLLTLDHIWLCPALGAISTSKHARSSDHQAVTTVIAPHPPG